MTEPAISSLADVDARARALSPRHSFVVQAPAGSGKTELLTQRYLALLANVDQPEHILAITFTRKAASEMRNRIVQALARSRLPEPEQAHEVQTWTLARAALAADERHGWQLEAHPARLRIQTIDSLNANLAKRLPLLAGTGAAMEIAQDTQPIYDAVCQRVLQWLGNGGEEAAWLETVLLHLANRVPTFVTMLGELLARRDHWLPLVMMHHDDAQLRASIEHTLQAAIEHHLTVLHEAMPIGLRVELIELWSYAAGNKLQLAPPPALAALLKACAALTAPPPCTAAALPLWRELATQLCTAKGEWRKTVTVNDGFPPKDAAKQRMVSLLANLQAHPALLTLLNGLQTLPAARFSDAQWQVVAALLRLLPKAVTELMVEFQGRAQLDYVELALRALQALGTPEQPTDMALALDERLQHILVDEFQDTSHTQMSLLNSLTAGWSEGDGRTLFCVGDPMQSIYRFRQAEVGLFIELQQRGLPNVSLESLRLQTNFRSTLPVVEWVNRSFPSILPPRDDSELGAVKYSASQTRPAALEHGGVHLHADIERSAQAEAQQIARLVGDTLARSPTDTIAILVGGRAHATTIAAELKHADIEFAAVDIERLQERPLVQDLISLTRALLHLADRTAWLACLRAPWCGLNLAQLHAIAADDERPTIWELLNDPDTLTRLDEVGRERVVRFNAVMSAALLERGRHTLRDGVERCWLALAGPATLQAASELDDAEAFFNRLAQLATAGDLEDSARLEAQLGELYATPQAGPTARVEIMTIHKSKGLEFDVVVLPSLHRTGKADANKLLRWTRVAGLGTEGLVFAAPAERGADNDSIYQWLCELEKQRTAYERGRLLYVAATRAKRELHLFGSVARSGKDGALGKPRPGSLLHLLWPHVSADFEAALLAQSDEQSLTSTPATTTFKRLPLDWQPPLPTPAVTAWPVAPSVNVEVEQPEFDWVGETSRHVGTVVHAELEQLVKLSSAQIQQWNAAQRRANVLLHLAELGVPEALRAAACDRAIQAIAATLNDARGRWILGVDAVHRDAAAELKLSGVVDGTLVNVVIDRSFVDEHGTRWIIDFKTSSHEGGGREAFLQSEQQRYRAQLERYARLMRAYQPLEPIRTALYFPLMGEWREVPTS